jgi:[ribosomal protein S18]-alanine N-acetyltransferase
MSAVPKEEAVLAPMCESDLDEVVELERAVYTHPWTRANFADSLRAHYDCRTLRLGRELIGYFVLMSGIGEGHLLNLSVSASRQRSGYGSALLRVAIGAARAQDAERIFLEVRPSNGAAQALYRRFGFREIAVRRGYYPAHRGREDALVYSLELA